MNAAATLRRPVRALPLVLALAVLLATLTAVPAAAQSPAPPPGPWTLERVTLAEGGGEPNGDSREVALSADASTVAFASEATNLAAGAHSTGAVYVRDLATGAIEVASRSASGPLPLAKAPTVDADGDAVAFASGTSESRQVWWRHLDAPAQLVSSLTPVHRPELAAAGDRLVALHEDGEIWDTDERTAVWAFAAGTPTQQRELARPGLPTQSYGEPALSADGTTAVAVLDEWPATQLHVQPLPDPFGTGAMPDREVLPVTRPSPYVQPAVSADGRVVVYKGGNVAHVFDRETGVDEVTTDVPTGASVESLAVSADGRLVAMVVVDWSAADGRVWVHDRESGRTEEVATVDTSTEVSLAADGRTLAFATVVDGLVPGDANGLSDVFVARRVDADPPTWPAGASLVADEVGATFVRLSWPAASDDTGVASYRVSRDGEVVAEVTTTTATVGDLAPDTAYRLAVRPVDGAGLVGPELALDVTTRPAAEPGTAALSAVAVPGGARLAWDAAAGAAGYTVWRALGEDPPQAVSTVTATTFDDLGLDAETTYRWFVTAVFDGVDRPHTAVATATVPPVAIGRVAWTGRTTPGSEWTVTFSGDPRRAATVDVGVSSWFAADGSELPAPRDTVVTVDASEDEPGRYRATFTLDQGIAAVRSVTARLVDGAGHEATADADRLPVTIRPRLQVQLATPPDGHPGARLIVTLPSRGGAQRTVDGGGTVTFDDFAPGDDYRLELWSAQNSLLGRADGVRLRAGMLTVLALDARAPATVGGRAVGSDGQALEGVTVTLVSDRVTTQATTGPGGRFGFATELRDGDTVTLRARPSGMMPYRAAERTVTLHHGRNDIDVPLDGIATGTLTGSVRRDEGRAAADARIVLSQQIDGRQWNVTTYSDADGRFEIDGLQGPGTVTASWGGSPAVRADVTVPSDGVVLPAFETAGAYQLHPQVFTRIGDRAWEGPVALDWATAIHLGLKVTTPAGRHDLRAGSLGFKGRPGDVVTLCGGGVDSGLAPACVELELGDDSVLRPELRLESAGLVRGRVVGSDGRPLGTGVRGSVRVGNTWINVDPNDSSFTLQLPTPGPQRLVATTHDPISRRSQSASRDFVLEERDELDLGDIAVGSNPWLRRSHVTAVRPTVLPGARAELRIAAHPGAAATVADGELRLPLPSGTAFVPGSLTIDGEPATPVGATAGALTVALPARTFGAEAAAPEDFAVVRYRVDLGDLTAGTKLRFPATLSVTEGGHRLEHHLGAAVVTVAGVTLNALDQTSDRDLVVNGMAPAGATVRVSDGDTFLGEAVSSPGGLWRLSIVLPDRGSIANHDLWAAAEHDGEELLSDVRTVRFNSRLPRLASVDVRQDGRGATFDPAAGTAMFPLVYRNEPITVGLRFTGDGEVVDPQAQIGATSAPATEVGDRWVATLDPGPYGLGPVRADYEVRPGDYAFDEPVPTEDQLRERLPVGLRDYTDPTVTRLPSEPDVDRVAMSARLPSLGASGRLETTATLRWGRDYTPTAADLAAAEATGVAVYGLQTSGTVTDTRAELQVSAWVPEDRLPRGEGAAAAAAALLDGRASEGTATVTASTRFVQVVLEKVFTGADLLNNIVGNEGGNDRLRRLESLKSWVTSNCEGSAPESFHRFANQLGERIIGDEYIKYGNNLGGGVIGAVDPLAGLALWFSTFPMGLLMDHSNDEAIDHLWSMARTDPECEDEEEEEDPESPPPDPDDPSVPDDPDAPLAIPTWIHDPSGYVYEAVESNRLEGVTATLTQADSPGGPWSVWDAEWFGQTNPQSTDGAGRYGWDVPEGWWQVQYAKDGYEPARSAALKVLPPHFDVNVGMVSYAPPEVDSVVASMAAGKAKEGGVTVTFDRYMRLSVAELDQIAVTRLDGSPMAGRVEAVAPEASPSGELLTRSFRFVPDKKLRKGETLVVTVDEMATSYAGSPMTERVTREVVVDKTGQGGKPAPR